MTDFENMTIEEAVKYCYKHRDKYIRDFDNIDEGIRSFDCLPGLVEDGYIKPTQLPEYGMDYDE